MSHDDMVDIVLLQDHLKRIRRTRFVFLVGTYQSSIPDRAFISVQKGM